MSGSAPVAAKFIDLHTHSTASDGAFAPADVVRAARTAGLAAIALTDHDTIDGVAEAVATGEEIGVTVIPGVELSAVEQTGETHVLGLHIEDSDLLARSLRELREMRRDRARRVVEKLNRLGIGVMLEDVVKEADGGAIGRPHIARALIAGGWCVDFREAFDRYLGNGRAAFVAKAVFPMRDAIDLIHRAGGIAVLAHPAGQGTRDRLAPLRDAGLDGVEVLHPSHSDADSQRIDALAEQLGLARSGGSDWHGSPDGARALGMMRVPGQWLESQSALVATRRSRGQPAARG